MNTKPLLSASVAMLFFLLLFSKPYIARCQTPNHNEPSKQVVRMEVDTVIKDGHNLNGKRVLIIEDGETAQDLEWAEGDKNVQVVVVEQNPSTKKRRNKRQEPVVIKEVRVVKVVAGEEGK